MTVVITKVISIIGIDAKMHLNNPEPEDKEDVLLQDSRLLDEDDEAYWVKPKKADHTKTLE